MNHGHTDDETLTRFPLSWPTGWKRTPDGRRRRSRFEKRGNMTRRHLTLADARTHLLAELRRLGATDVILSTNVKLKSNGLPYSGEREPDDVGAAVYFRLRSQAKCLASDLWTRVADNVSAMARHIAALRAIDRYGVGTLDQAFAGYAPRLQPVVAEWWLVLNVPRGSTREQVQSSFEAMARRSHPDAGGTHEEMARLTEARRLAFAELS